MVKIIEMNETRRSSRIQTMELNKAAVRQTKKQEALSAAAAAVNKKLQPAMKKQRVDSMRSDVSSGVVVVNKKNDKVTEKGSALSDCVVDVDRTGVEAETSSYKRVTDTISIYNKYFSYFVQKEEDRCNMPDNEKNPTKSNARANKGEEKSERPDLKSKSKRPDLKALSCMQKSNLTLVPQNRIGSIPGVDVGHQFFSRAEMVTVGVHNHCLNGIDYIGANQKKDYPKYKLPITVGIVMSGGYEHDIDNLVEIVYTGQGGNDLHGNKRQIGDQKMVRGNLGLKHSMDQNVPVRVIRGHKSSNSGKVYTYNGLYKVENYWAEKVAGTELTVYKFKLIHVPGQPKLMTKQVFFSQRDIANSIAEQPGLVCKDISGGLENIPIPATNNVDDPPVPPTGLTYIRSLKFANDVTPPPEASRCNCKGTCNPKSCECAKLNGSGFPYIRGDGGRLTEAKGVIYECGPKCKCGPSCINRTTQRGLKYRLEVYKTPMKGWAVRSWDLIPSGAFVCEYIGVLKKITGEDPDNMYIMDIDCLETMNGLGQREKRLGSVPISMQDTEAENDNVRYSIDGGSFANVTRYINHSCQPNLFVQCVLSAHHDITQARVTLFAADDIQPMEELAYDYGYELNSVQDSDGNIKQLPCHCGAPNCRKMMF